MEKKYRLEPFDLEKAKVGEPICTVDGRDARIICWDRKSDDLPILALVGEKEESVYGYTRSGIYRYSDGCHGNNLAMKVEVEEPTVFAEVAGEITPFEELKADGFVDLKSLEYLIIKTYDGKFLKIWKRNLPEEEWEEAQKVASEIGEGWRCPTRHECIDIYDARFNGLDDAMEEIGGDNLKEVYWTSKTDSDPQYNASSAAFFYGYTGDLCANYKYTQYSVRPVQSFEIKNNLND